MEKEIWKAYKGYEKDYAVSNLGRVKSLKFGKEKILKLLRGTNKYLQVSLIKHNKDSRRSVHQLVAEMYLNHTPNGIRGLVVDHINGNKDDNRAINLQLLSQRENLKKGNYNHSSIHHGVSWNKQMRKWKAGIKISGKPIHLGYFKDEAKAAEAYQIALENHLEKERIKDTNIFNSKTKTL